MSPHGFLLDQHRPCRLQTFSEDDLANSVVDRAAREMDFPNLDALKESLTLRTNLRTRPGVVG